MQSGVPSNDALPAENRGMGIAVSMWIQQPLGIEHVVTIAADASLRLALARDTRRAHLTQLVHRRDQGISSWSDFYAVMGDQPFLAKLDEYPEALLIAGCDWSATTAITRLFKRLPRFADSSWDHDDELDGALLLAGRRDRPTAGRPCFQTTYVRERYHEYFAHDDFKLVWIVREPRAAVRSGRAEIWRESPARYVMRASSTSS